MIKQRKIFYIISVSLAVLSIVSLVIFRLPLGIDFTGGSLVELKYASNSKGVIDIPSLAIINERLADVTGPVQIQKTDQGNLLLRTRDIDENTHQQVLERLQEQTTSRFEEARFETIGPVIGKETIKKSFTAVIFVSIVIVLFIAWAFRKISYPIKSFKYGVIALVALLHDVLITVGVFSVFAYFGGEEVGVPFIAAVLTVLGYSVNDTIVIFDRIRENLFKVGKGTFEELVSKSVRETIVRSINTALSTIIVLLAVFLFGGATIHGFVFILIVGIILGTYSSIFVASPLLVSWAGRRRG